MVAHVELVADEGGCGMSVPVTVGLKPRWFMDIAHKVLMPDAIRTLTRLQRPLRFELYCDPDKGIAGWRA